MSDLHPAPPSAEPGVERLARAQRLRQAAADHAVLWPRAPVPALCWLHLRTETAADGHAALAPDGRCAGQGWLECADRTAWLEPGQELSALLAQASPLLCAELALSETRSLHLRRARQGVVITELAEVAEPGQAPDQAPALVSDDGARPCLVWQRQWPATHPQRTLVYRVYWTLPTGLDAAPTERGRLRPWAARLAQIVTRPS